MTDSTRGKKSSGAVTAEASSRPSQSPHATVSGSASRSRDDGSDSSLSEMGSSDSEPPRPSIGQTLADQFRARALSQANDSATMEDSEDDLNMPPAYDIGGLPDDDLPDLDIDALAGVRPKRSTAKTDAYKIRAPKFAPSQRRQEAARAKESAAVKAGIMSPAKTTVDKDLNKLFAQRKKMKQMGTDLAGMEEADRFMLTFTQEMASRGQHVASGHDPHEDGDAASSPGEVLSLDAESSAGRMLRAETDEKGYPRRPNAAVSDSEPEDQADENQRVDKAISSRMARKKRKKEHPSQSPESDEAGDVLAILQKDRSPSKRVKSRRKAGFWIKQAFWTSLPVVGHHLLVRNGRAAFTDCQAHHVLCTR